MLDLSIIENNKQQLIDPHTLIHARLYPAYEKLLEQSTRITMVTPCNCCNRSAVQFNNEGYEFIDSYKVPAWFCETCQIWSLPNLDLLGLENGNIPYRLSSFKSSYLIIPVDENQPIELWAGGKYAERLAQSKLLIKPLSGHIAKAELLKTDYRRNQLVVESTLRKELYLSRLRLSTAHNLYLITELGVVIVNYEHYDILSSALASLEKPTKNKVITAIRGLKCGYYDMQSPAVAIFDKLTDEQLAPIQNAMVLCDSNPIGLLFMLDALSA